MIRRCEDIRDSIGPWLDCELNGSSVEEVRVHLESCPECREERRQLEKLKASLSELLAAPPPDVPFDGFWSAVERRIARRAWYEDFLDWVRELAAPPRLAWAVPAVIVLLLGVIGVDSFLPGWRLPGQGNNFAAVDSIDGFGRNVAVLREDETKTTVIWIYQNQEGEDESTGETSEAGPSF